jgi:lipase ATG15
VPLTGQHDKNHLLNFTLRSQPGRLTKAEGASSAGRAQKVFSDGPDVHSTVMVPRPNITDKETVVNLAKMTSDAYIGDPSLPGWFNLSDGFNRSQSFGWEEDGLRGHVFANADNSTVVVSFKGTTIGAAFHLNTISNRLIGGTADSRERTRTRDRENDNVFFSCCCATQRADPYWYGSVCDCRNSTYSCNSTCLSQECGRQDRYYTRAMDVILNITSLYPTSQLWTVGHSLGGAVASLMGMTFNVPAVAFESPPDRLPAYRLGLALPPTDYPITYHFGNTADPIFMGACNGYSSSCSAAGYAFESVCFTGKRCVYDTIGDKSWHLNILNHRINTVIDQVLETYETVPNCTSDDECVDCFNWHYFH